MSDFLDNLASRSLNLNPGDIQPRRVSHFERATPVQANFDTDVQTGFEVVNAEVEIRQDSRPPARNLPPQSPQHMDSPVRAESRPPQTIEERSEEIAPVEKNRRSPRTQVREASIPPEITAHRSAPPRDEVVPRAEKPQMSSVQPVPPMPIFAPKENAPVRPAQRDHTGEQRPAETRRESIMPLLEKRPEIKPTSSRTNDTPITPAEIVREIRPLVPPEDEIARLVRKLMPPTSIEPAVGATRRVAPTETATESTPIHPAETRPRIALDLPIVPQVSLPDGTRGIQNASEAESPAPTINVTIGRIEVRATPPAAAQKSSKESARRGAELEAYLRQRAGGKNE